MMQYKNTSIVSGRLEILDSGGSYPPSSNISLTSQLYKPNSLNPVYLTVLKNTGRISFTDMIKRINEFQPCKIGDIFGKIWDTHWFHFQFEVSNDYMDNEIHLYWDSSSEAELFSNDGLPLQAFLGDNTAFHRDKYIVYRKGIKNDIQDGKVEYFVEMACLNFFGNFLNGDMCEGIDPNKIFTLNACQLEIFNKDCWDLLMDFRIIKDCLNNLDPTQQSRSEEAGWIGNQICNVVTAKNSSSFTQGKELAKQFLGVGNYNSQHQIFATGHCHIDMGWLWPFAETRRKGYRSWSTQIELFKHYPKFKFCASTSCLYEWVKQDYPNLFAEIVDYHNKGNWIIVGGTFLEFDGNLPSGESFCRHFLLGQKFFKQNFGEYCQIFFLPDTFGYSAQLPQIAKLSGINYFFTKKLAWNKFDPFPNNNFVWRGIDGTQLLSHFPPSETYSGSGNITDVIKSQTNFRDKGRSNESMYLFGVGDGGGGPLPEMIEKLQRQENLAGIQMVKFDDPVSFFKQLEQHQDNLMIWDGELYLEFHNGTYTTMAHNKKFNRICEQLIKNLEIVDVFQYIISKKKERFDKNTLIRYWKTMLLYHFHDVIPGTSIEMVYTETDANYQIMIKEMSDAINQIISKIPSLIGQEKISDTNNYIIAFNESNYLKHVSYCNTLLAPYEISILPISNNCKSKNNSCIKLTNSFDKIFVENIYLIITIAKSGQIVSIIDKETMIDGDIKTAKEVLSGPGNVLKLHEDIPQYWDAWDLWIYYTEKFKVQEANSVKLVQNDHSMDIQFDYKIGEMSILNQIMRIYDDSRRIDFINKIEWNEDRKILRVYFPLKIRSDFASFDIQDGFLKRSSTNNT